MERIDVAFLEMTSPPVNCTWAESTAWCNLTMHVHIDCTGRLGRQYSCCHMIPLSQIKQVLEID